MAGSTLGREWDIAKILDNYGQRINELEKRSAGDVAAAIAAAVAAAADPIGCRVHETAVQSIPDNTVTALTFTSERFDTDSMHSTSVNTSRITINSGGIYAFGGGARIANGADYTTINLRVRLNGTTDIAHSDVLVSAGATIAQIKQVNGLYQLAAGDYIELMIMQDNTANAARNTVVNANFTSEFWAIRQGASI